jgi:hypothetical protein
MPVSPFDDPGKSHPFIIFKQQYSPKELSRFYFIFLCSAFIFS